MPSRPRRSGLSALSIRCSVVLKGMGSPLSPQDRSPIPTNHLKEPVRSTRLDRLSAARSLAVTGWVLLTCLACGATSPWSKGSSSSVEALPRIVLQDVERHPRLVTLVRQGDPQSALVLRISPPPAALDGVAQLAALVSVRLAKSAPNARVSADLAGITLSGSVDSPAGLRTLATRFDAAMRNEVAPSETTSPAFRDEIARFRQILSSQVSAAVLATCLEPELDSSVDLERFRGAAFAQHWARWGVVGSPALVNGAGKTLRELPAWPDAEPGHPRWPAKDLAVLAATKNPMPRVDIGWRVPNARRALTVGRELRAQLGDVLSSLPLPMRLERVASTPLPEGACFGLSLVPESESAAATLDDLIAAARIAARELQSVKPLTRDDESDTLAIIEESDPRSAARMAAMLSLSADADGMTDRFRVELDRGVALAAVEPTQDQRRALESLFDSEHPSSNIASVQAVEVGQGQVHALLASPCASLVEPARSAGLTGFLVRVLAARYRDFAGVTLEPWVTAHGVGLFARAKRLSAQEAPEHLAARLGDALGRVLGTASFDANDVWRTRSELLASLGPGPRPALWRALQAFAPQQPGIVLADGTFAAVEAVSFGDLREQRTRFLRLPLKLAVLSNVSPRQSEVVRDSIARFLALVRSAEQACPNWPEPLPLVKGEVRVQTRGDDSGDATVTLAMALPTSDRLDEAHSTLLLRMLNGPTGWLSESLREKGIVGTAEARVVGGARRRGLVVALGTLPSVADAAIGAVRVLFEQLADGRLPERPLLASAIGEWAHAEVTLRFDPRARLEDLWLGRTSIPKLTERSTRDYLTRSFAANEPFIVRSEPIVSEPVVAPRTKR